MKNTYKIVAKFEYNTNKYFIAMVNNSKVVLVKYDKNKTISTDFSDEEYELLNIVYNSLCIDRETSVYIKDEKVKNNLYKIYYDTNSKIYFWDSINNVNDEECNKILNFKYNNMINTYFLDDEKTDDEQEKISSIVSELEDLEKESLAKIAKLLGSDEKVNYTYQPKEKTQEEQSEETKQTLEAGEKNQTKAIEESEQNDGTETVEETKQEDPTKVIGETRKKDETETIEETRQEEPTEQTEEEQSEEDKKVDKGAYYWKSIIDLEEEETSTGEDEIVPQEETTVENALKGEFTELVNTSKENAEDVDKTEENDEESLEDRIKKAKVQAKEQRIVQIIASRLQEEPTEQEQQEIEEMPTTKQQIDDKTKKSVTSNEYYTKYIKFKKLLPIYVSASMIATTFLPVIGSQGRSESHIVKNSVSSVDEKQEVSYDYEEIRQALMENPYLTVEEKTFISKFKFVFDEYHEYMDLNLIASRYKTLKINYNRDYQQENSESFSVLVGTYNEETNETTMNGAESFEDVKKADFAHEYGHVLQDGSQRYTMELINEAFKREMLRKAKEEEKLKPELFEDNTNTYSNFGNGYSEHLYIYYILASMMDKESLRNYQFKCDDEILVSQLCKIDNNVDSKTAKQNAYQLLTYIDNLRIWDEESQMYKINSQAENQCLEKLNYYFVQKNGMNIEEDLNCVIHKLYYSEDTYAAVEKTLLDSISSTTDISDATLGTWRTVLPKTYFSDDHKNASITFNSPEFVTIEITDELCEKYRENYLQITKQDQSFER